MECICEGVFENMNYIHEGNDSVKKKKKNTQKLLKRKKKKSVSRLFHHVANANQKKALFPKSCTEVKAERKFLPKVQQSLDCATGKKHVFLI